MKIIVADVENSTTAKDKGKIDLGPYNPANFLVSVGWCLVENGEIGPVKYFFLQHNDLDPEDVDWTAAREFQEALATADLFVAHNAKHDAQWLLETGHKMPPRLWDTMIAEYVLLRSRKKSLKLKDIAERRDVTRKRSDLTEEYLDKGIGFEEMPMPIVEEYGIADVRSCAEVFLQQYEQFQQKNNQSLVGILDLMNDFCTVLTDVERNGIKIDFAALEAVKTEYLKEQAELKAELQEICHELMGDTPINLGSDEQLSWVIYSRSVNDKKKWKETFNIGTDERGKALRKPKMKPQEFRKVVVEQTTPLRKTKAHQCPECQGTGKYAKTKKDGTPYAKSYNCKHCGGGGIIYEKLGEWAGLMFKATSPKDTSQGGFATNKETLEYLAALADYEKKPAAAKFLRKVMRLNAVDVYLSSFVGGIERNVQADGLLHCKFNQTTTSTARLSSSDPNFQNQPRGKTFPVRRVVISRWADIGGRIMEADFRQLEFRVAAELSGDPVMLQDILDDIDAHQRTADILTANGQPTERQGAKPDTFKPLYGGTSGTPAQVAYYKWFFERYERLREWDIELMEEAIRTKKIKQPTGREYAFPYVERAWDGLATYPYRQQIVNWPVQGFATGDIVPLSCILLHRKMKLAGVKSILINTVHDSIIVDVYPGEELIIARMMYEAMVPDTVAELKRLWDITMIVPLDIEIAVGPNWLDKQEIEVPKHAA